MIHTADSPKHIVIIGRSGGIAGALAKIISETMSADSCIHSFSRHQPSTVYPGERIHLLDDYEESSLNKVVDRLPETIHQVWVATGMLSNPDVTPEKALKQITAEQLQRSFVANAVVPALMAKIFIPKLARRVPSLFACLSARVGSISDNRLGGWYSYRASKAALNMIIKSAAIETARTHPEAIIVGFHPGTVATSLSQAYLKTLDPSHVFSPDQAAHHLLNVSRSLTPQQSGRFFAWDGQEIQP
ncbi:MAG: SDR family NAD(P)-dependent oxidoreductase [Pseudomonadota bacterium]|nr:SDR family NAD(P)-dependent oxidoreductase [Pseudomonadota bacterium]